MKLTKCTAGKNEYGKMGWFIQFPFDALFLGEDFKDCIDYPFRQWNPATKTWWVDEDCGQILSELFDNWTHPVSSPKKVAKVSCSICNDKGIVPSKVLGKFSGKLIPNCWDNCECQEGKHEYRRPLKPSDFDFAMSYSNYRSLCRLHGWPDPGSCELPEEAPEPIPEAPKWTGRQWDTVEQYRLAFLHYQKQYLQLYEKLKEKDGF